MASPGTNANEDTYTKSKENWKQGNQSGFAKLSAKPGNTKKNDGCTQLTTPRTLQRSNNKRSNKRSPPLTRITALYQHEFNVLTQDRLPFVIDIQDKKSSHHETLGRAHGQSHKRLSSLLPM
eukprot:scaffold6995_cov66-Attheya_sp.AAC.2